MNDGSHNGCCFCKLMFYMRVHCGSGPKTFVLFSCAKSFVRNSYRSSREISNSAVISSPGFVYCFSVMQIFMKQSTWLVHMWGVYSVDLKVGKKNISLVARLSHLSGCFWLFAPKVWEVFWTFVWYFVILRMQVQWWGYLEVVGTLKLYLVVWTFCTHRQQGRKIFRCDRAWRSHLVESPLSKLLYWRVPLSPAMLALCSLPYALFIVSLYDATSRHWNSFAMFNLLARLESAYFNILHDKYIKCS